MLGGSDGFVMVPVGQPGPPFSPGETYFSVALLSVHMPGGGFFAMSKFAPVVWASVTQDTVEGENGKRQLLGLYPTEGNGRPKFAREDRVTLVDLQLVPRIISGEELDVDFSLAKVREKDFVAGVLKTASDLATSPATSFLSQIAPVTTTVTAVTKAVTDTIGSFKANVDDLLDADKMELLGGLTHTLRYPSPSGVYAFIRGTESQEGLTHNANTNKLSNAKGPITTPYAVLRLRCETNRPDWATLPDLKQAWNAIRDIKVAGGDVIPAIKQFERTAQSSPDLTPSDAKKLTAAVTRKFVSELNGLESESASDLPDMESALGHLLKDDISEIEKPARNGPWKVDGPFRKNFEQALSQAGSTPVVTLEGYRDFIKLLSEEQKKPLTDAQLEAVTLASLTPEETAEIFYKGYWSASHCTDMPNEALAAMMFDAAVNHGAKQAIRLLQQGAGLPAFNCTGAWNEPVKARLALAAKDTASLIDGMLIARERFYRQLVTTTPSQGTFLRAWIDHLAQLKARVMPMLADAPAGKPGESQLIEDTQQRAGLRVAAPDFSEIRNALEPKKAGGERP